MVLSDELKTGDGGGHDEVEGLSFVSGASSISWRQVKVSGMLFGYPNFNIE